jgi:hypothetical protein
MRIILDESVPQKLRLLIEGGHTVVTTWYQGWSGPKKRGAADSGGRSKNRATTYFTHHESAKMVPA